MSFDLESTSGSPLQQLTSALGHKKELPPPPQMPPPWWQHLRPTEAAEATQARMKADDDANRSLNRFMQETNEEDGEDELNMPPPMLPAALWDWDDAAAERDAISSSSDDLSDLGADNGSSTTGGQRTKATSTRSRCGGPPAAPSLMALPDSMMPPALMR